VPASHFGVIALAKASNACAAELFVEFSGTVLPLLVPWSLDPEEPGSLLSMVASVVTTFARVLKSKNVI